MSKTYRVECEWDDTGWWVVTVPEVPGAVTQSRRLDHVPRDVGEVLSLLTGETPDAYGIELETHLPGDLAAEADRARGLRRQAEAAAAAAQEATAHAARRLHTTTRLTYRDIGALLGISHQRAQQLATAPAPSASVTRPAARGGLTSGTALPGGAAGSPA